MPRDRTALLVGLTLTAVVLSGGCTTDEPAPAEPATVEQATAAPSSVHSVPEPIPAASGSDLAPPTPARFPLVVARRADGDSFTASDGVEYRVGMINAPETGDCGGRAASDRAYALLADGFAAEPYSDDGNGRTVARILTPSGDLGVILAREGLADDRYLRAFADEHPAYAAALEAAFAAAEDERAGLWATCWAEG